MYTLGLIFNYIFLLTLIEVLGALAILVLLISIGLWAVGKYRLSEKFSNLHKEFNDAIKKDNTAKIKKKAQELIDLIDKEGLTGEIYTEVKKKAEAVLSNDQ